MAALIIAAAVIAFVLLAPLRAEFRMCYNADGLEYSLRFKVFGIRLRRPRMKRRKENKDGMNDGQQSRSRSMSPSQAVLFIYDNIDTVKKTIRKTASYAAKHLIKIKRLIFHAVIGFEDAMDTALIYGWSAAAVYNAAAAAQRKMRLVKHDIKIEPDFNDPHISAEAEVIITTNVFHMAVISVIAARHAYPLIGKFKEMFSGADAEGGE